MHGSTLTICLLLSTAAAARPQILLFPAVGRPSAVTVHGRVLKEAPSRGSSTLSRNLRLLTAPDWDGAPVEIFFHGRSLKARAGDDGVFEATFSFSPEDAPAAGVHRVDARVPGATARSAVRLVDPKTPFIVISDFDDTVAVTNVTDRTRFVEAALLRDAETQAAVPGMNRFYECLVTDRRVPLAFVSGSPHQFGPRISRFLARHQFPPAALYLRDLGPATLSGYKQPVIRKILNAVDQPAILIGDSGEHDPEVYAQIRSEFPNRILAIFIHDVGGASRPDRFKDMVLFKDARDAAVEAQRRGFLTSECRTEKFGSEDPR